MPKAHTFIKYGEGLNRGSMRRDPRKQWVEQTLLPILPMVEWQAMHPNGTQGKFKEPLGVMCWALGRTPTSVTA